MVIPVKICLPSKSIVRGYLHLNVDGPILTTQKGENFLPSVHPNGILFSILSNDIRGNIAFHLESNDWVSFQPKSATRHHSMKTISQNEMYPPSSNSWVGHLSESGSEAIYSTFPIANSNKELLLISDALTENVYGYYKINPYEKGILFMEKDWDIWSKLYGKQDSSEKTEILKQLLETKPPSWSELTSLVEEVNIPNLTIEKTMRDTMNQLVPKSFPEDIREELMAFLAFSINLKIPKEDPLTFNSRYESTPLLLMLSYHHIQYLMDNKKPPNYVRIFALADRGMLHIGDQPATEAVEQNPWDLAWMHLVNLNPARRERVLDLVNELNQNEEIMTSLPISRKDAESSKEKWTDRFTTILDALSLRGHVHNEKVGLRTLIYVGGAHRWPHKHLAWIARLGIPSEKPPFFQLMVMPQTAAERVQRVKTNIVVEDWSMTKANLNLYDTANQRWKTKTDRILKSVSSKRTLRQLEREFHYRFDKKVYTLSEVESRVLGFSTLGIILNSLELGKYEEYLGIENNYLREILTQLRNNGVIQLRYSFYQLGLFSIYVQGHGPKQKIQSLTRSFLKHTPTTTVRIANDGADCYIISRVPENEIYNISTKLPTAAAEEGIELKVMRVDAYAAYNHNLYERLLRPDGTWDDDISGFLDQMRS